MALVSVIIPIFNAEAYLDQALRSVREQTHKDLQIICLNDGSTDGSLAIMREHAAADPRIQIIDKPNEGYGATCNRGLDEARGEWVAILEPDDWIEPRMYADLLALAERYGGADAGACGMGVSGRAGAEAAAGAGTRILSRLPLPHREGHVASEGTPPPACPVCETPAAPVDIAKSAYWRIWMPDTPQQLKMNCSFKNRIHPPAQPFAVKDAPHLLMHHPSIWSALYRRAFLVEKGIRFREYPGAGWADNPFLVETLCQTERIVYTDEAYYCYREDTPQKAAAFAKRAPVLPLERCLDMFEVLERLGVTDEAVLAAQNCRGFTYLGGVLEEVDLVQDDEVLEAAIRMCMRMDRDLVLNDPRIAPGSKRLYCLFMGLEPGKDCPRIRQLPYLRNLAAQGAYTFGNTGPEYGWYFLRNFLRTRASRHAGV